MDQDKKRRVNNKQRPKRKKRYSRRQILFNRLLVLVVFLALVFGVFKGVRWALIKLDIIETPSVFESEVIVDENKENKSKNTKDEEKTAETAYMEEEAEPAAAEEYTGIDLENASDPYYEAQKPMLVGPNNPIPSDFVPNLVDIYGGYKFDKKAVKALNDMMEAAKKDGISLYVLSAYRSFESQTRLFTQKVDEYVGYGNDKETAVVYASKWVAKPGTSEHGTGLAVDLNSLEESFDQTAAFKWLQEHCAEYGFIMRYPKDKTDITKINYEPWHYRYVGSNHAKIIMEQGITLEEYLA